MLCISASPPEILAGWIREGTGDMHFMSSSAESNAGSSKYTLSNTAVMTRNHMSNVWQSAWCLGGA